jgi:hypothetical protein
LSTYIYTRLASTKQEKDMKISYKLVYGGSETAWEENCASTPHKSQQVVLEYSIGFADQSVELHVEAKSNSDSDSRNVKVVFNMQTLIKETMTIGEPAKPTSIKS